MKIRTWARIAPALALALAGCKGFWDVPSGSGSGGGNGSNSGVFYVLNQKTAEVVGYSIASGSTTLTSVGSSISLAGTGPECMAITRTGGFVYIGTDTGIYGFSVNATTGALSALASGQALVQAPVFRIAVDPSGNWLIAAATGVAQIVAYQLDPTTGGLLNNGTTQALNLNAGATAIQGIAVTPSSSTNAYVFVAEGQNGFQVVPLNSAASTTIPLGNPANPVAPVHTLGADLAIAVDSSTTRPLLYVAETGALTATTAQPQTGGLRVFNIGANSAVTELTSAGSPYATGGTGPSAILPTTSYVYVANRAVQGSSTGNITAFAITTTGTANSLTAVTDGTIAAGTGTAGLAEDNTGTYILAANPSGSPDLNVYTIQTSGALKSYGTAATGSDPTQAISIVAHP